MESSDDRETEDAENTENTGVTLEDIIHEIFKDIEVEPCNYSFEDYTGRKFCSYGGVCDYKGSKHPYCTDTGCSKETTCQRVY